MGEVQYREACETDAPAMAEVRAGDWGTADYWRDRIRRYMAGELNAREALTGHVCFVAVDGDRVIGLVAGHRTRRFGCDGELEWISVLPEYRNRGVATQLIFRLAEWFGSQGVRRVCVDVDPDNQPARAFYARHGARHLKPHWMAWDDIATGARRIPKAT